MLFVAEPPKGFSSLSLDASSRLFATYANLNVVFYAVHVFWLLGIFDHSLVLNIIIIQFNQQLQRHSLLIRVLYYDLCPLGLLLRRLHRIDELRNSIGIGEERLHQLWNVHGIGGMKPKNTL